MNADAVAQFLQQLRDIWTCAEDDLQGQADRLFSPHGRGAIAHPINDVTSGKDFADRFCLPLRRAFTQTRRRDELFISGLNRRDTGGFWVASFCHYVGNFNAPLYGIKPHGHLAFLRSGEFYRIEEGKIVDFRIICDFIDLMRQTGYSPFAASLGAEMTFPGPATHDGVNPADRVKGVQSLDLVEAMLADLRAFDPETFQSDGQTGSDGYWADTMMWYGPAGIGSNYLWDGFQKDHRIPFLTAFPDRVGGNHYCRIGDGDYAAVSGWPSMTMTHAGDYLGIKATGKPLTLRVMDFYRCENGKIAENWVFLDYGDLLEQMGVRLFDKT
jgi:predicted ester cyclase